MTGHGQTKQKERSVEQQAERHREEMKKREDKVIVSSDESFPASDPPSFNPGVTGATDTPKKKH